MVQPIPHTLVKIGGNVLSSETIDVLYNVTLRDAGKYLQFNCDWNQKGPDGEILFYGQEDSIPLRITSRPVLEANTSTRSSAPESRWQISISIVDTPMRRGPAVSMSQWASQQFHGTLWPTLRGR